MMTLERLFSLMADKKASDLFLSVGSPVTVATPPTRIWVAVTPGSLTGGFWAPAPGAATSTTVADAATSAATRRPIGRPRP